MGTKTYDVVEKTYINNRLLDPEITPTVDLDLGKEKWEDIKHLHPALRLHEEEEQAKPQAKGDLA